MNVIISYLTDACNKKEIKLTGCREVDWQGLVTALLISGIDRVEVRVLGW